MNSIRFSAFIFCQLLFSSHFTSTLSLTSPLYSTPLLSISNALISVRLLDSTILPITPTLLYFFFFLFSPSFSFFRTLNPFITITTPKETLSVRYEPFTKPPSMPYSPLGFDEDFSPTSMKSSVHTRWMREIQRAIAQQAKSTYLFIVIISCVIYGEIRRYGIRER